MDKINVEQAVMPTQHASWLTSAALCLGARGDTRIAGLQDTVSGSGLRELRHGRGPRRLAPIGAAETGEPSDLPWADEADLRRRVAALARQGRAVEFPRVPKDSRSLVLLREAFAGRGFVVDREAPPTPYIPLDASWIDPETHFNAGRRSDFRRSRRHAEKLGALTFEMHDAPDAAELARLLVEAYAVEARSWKGAGGTALEADTLLGPFFRRFAQSAREAGILRLAFMRIDGRAVGMQLAVELHGALWLLKIGYDPAYSRCSPGNLLMLFTLGEAARRGLSSYEFLGSVAPWTAAWTTELRAFRHVRFYPWSVPGLLAFGQDATVALRARLRERKQRVRAAAEQADAPEADAGGVPAASAPGQRLQAELAP